MTVKRIKYIPIFGLLITVFSSCSLKYGMAVQDESNVPEFIFTDANFNRYEENLKTAGLKTERLEQYKDGKSMYAKNVEFELLNKDGTLNTKGSCELLASDTDEEKYTLYGNIQIRNEKNDMDVTADNLKWNGKSEQLTSGRNDMVMIKKGNTTIFGSGFSASGVSRTFAFTGVVTGEIETESQSDLNGQDTGAEEDEAE